MEYSYNIYDPEWVERKREVQLYDVFSVGCTYGYYCNAPSVLYSNNNICVKSGRGVLNTPTLTNIQLKSRKDDMIVEDNIYGSKLIEEKINSTKQRIILNSIEEGVYLYKINNCDAVVNRGKLILTK